MSIYSSRGCRPVFQREPRPKRREVTARRVAAAKLHLKRERDRLPLFTDQVLAEQTTATERIDLFDAAQLETQWHRRKLQAQCWRSARSLLRSFLPELRESLIQSWNRTEYPRDGTMFSSFVSRFEKNMRVRYDRGERYFVFRIGETIRILLWQPQHVPSTALGGPFDTFSQALAFGESESRPATRQAEVFRLQNDRASKSAPVRAEVQPARQRPLFSGLDCLAGQTDLFDDLDTLD